MGLANSISDISLKAVIRQVHQDMCVYENIHCDNVERSESGMYFFAYDFSQATVCKLLHKVPWYSLTAPEAIS